MPVLLKQNSTQDGMITEVSPKFLDRRRQLRVGLSNHRDDVFIHILGFTRRPLIQRSTTPHTEILIARRLLITPRTHDRTERFALVFTDVHAVDPRDLSVGSLPEDRDVSGCDLRPALPAVVFLQMRLGNPLAGEITRRRLPEVRRRHRLRHARALRSLTRNLQQHRITHRLCRVQPRPKRRASSGVWMDVQPLLDVGDTRDDDGAALALLPLDGHPLPVIVVTDRVDCEVSELEGPGAEVPRESDESLITVVPARVEHGFDVLSPEKHLPGVGSRVIVTRVSRRNPLNRVGLFIAIGGEFAEHPEGGSVVLVGLGVLILLVDPGDDALGRSLRLERGREFTVLFGDLPVVDEMEAMSLVAVIGLPEIEFIAHSKEGVSISGANVFFGFDACAEAFDGIPRVPDHGPEEDTASALMCGYLNPQSQPLPGHKSVGSGTKNNQPAATSRGVAA